MHSSEEQAETQNTMKILNSDFLPNNTFFSEMQMSPWPLFFSFFIFAVFFEGENGFPTHTKQKTVCGHWVPT